MLNNSEVLDWGGRNRIRKTNDIRVDFYMPVAIHKVSVSGAVASPHLHY